MRPPEPGTNYFYNTDYAIRYIKLKSSFLRIIIMLLFVVLIIAMLGSYIWAVKFEDKPFFQTLLIETCAGIGMFILIPIIFLAKAKLKKAFHITLFLFSIVSGYIAYFVDGIYQSLLIEFSIGLLLLMAIEELFEKMLSAVREELRINKEELDLIKQEKSDYEREEAERNFGHGFPELPDGKYDDLTK